MTEEKTNKVSCSVYNHFFFSKKGPVPLQLWESHGSFISRYLHNINMERKVLQQMTTR